MNHTDFLRELKRDWRYHLWGVLLWPKFQWESWRIRRRIAKMPRIQVWPLGDVREHVVKGRASLRCWCKPELEVCEGSLLVKHRDRRGRLLAELSDLQQYTKSEYARLCAEDKCPLSVRQAMALRMTLTDPTGFNMRIE